MHGNATTDRIFAGEKSYDLFRCKVIKNIIYRISRVYCDRQSIDTNLVFFFIFDCFFFFILYASCNHTKCCSSIDNGFGSLSGSAC